MRWCLILILTLWLTSCGGDGHLHISNSSDDYIHGDLSDFKQRGTLRVITDYNSTNYFVYKGMEIGYQYELLQELTKELGVKLELIVSNDIKKNYEALQSGKADLIATNLPITNNISPGISYTEPHCFSRQVLVQRKGTPAVYLDPLTNKYNRLVRNQLDLAKKTIHVQENSAYFLRLKGLENEIGDTIDVIQEPDYSVEQLIGLVASGEIDFTVCDENIGIVNQNYYPNIDIETAISFQQKIAWATRTSSPEFLKVINKWISKFRQTYQYSKIYQKYFINKRTAQIVDTKAHLLYKGQVSVFDDIIKDESKIINWDWRLLASVVYQESHFDPEAESWAGAAGLMQLMPQTAQQFGVTSITSPRDNLKGGVKYLQWIQVRINAKIPTASERIKFVLASYNVGLGHVFDAMKLAEKYGKNPKIWTDNVDYYMLNKSQPEYYNDTIVKFGYCRGEETYKYVVEVLDRFDNYRKVLN